MGHWVEIDREVVVGRGRAVVEVDGGSLHHCDVVVGVVGRVDEEGHVAVDHVGDDGAVGDVGADEDDDHVDGEHVGCGAEDVDAGVGADVDRGACDAGVEVVGGAVVDVAVGPTKRCLAAAVAPASSS